MADAELASRHAFLDWRVYGALSRLIDVGEGDDGAIRQGITAAIANGIGFHGHDAPIARSFDAQSTSFGCNLLNHSRFFHLA